MIAETLDLPPSLARLLEKRGISEPDDVEAFLSPSLDRLGSPHAFQHMGAAVKRLQDAIRLEEPVAIYADRDVDGLTGLAILTRALRTLGAVVHWGSPLKGRGVERAVLETLARQGAKVLIFVDCGSGEDVELSWLAEQGISVIVADHHRLSADRPEALAWIHPAMMEPSSGLRPPSPVGRRQTSAPCPLPSGEGARRAGEGESPAGCVMAFKLAQALYLSFMDHGDRARLDYFLFDHLDLLCLGILADRMPLTGENRVFVSQGLQRLAQTRKTGLNALLRFFRLASRPVPVSVREATWQIIPLLNAAGRLGQPQWTADLLLTEDPWVARQCIDALLEFNTQRRSAQEKSIELFEKAVLEQCAVETDPVLIAIAEGLEPSVTGLAAQSLVRKYGRPVFLFVDQGAEAVGSARGTPEVDLFSWVEEQRDRLIKFGGHHGAVGLTIRLADFAALRDALMSRAQEQAGPRADGTLIAEVDVSLQEIDRSWWEHLQRLEPFGPGFPAPVFQLHGIETIRPTNKRKSQRLILTCGSIESVGETARADNESYGEGPWTAVATPVAAPKEEIPFKWMIQEVRKSHA